MKTLHLLMGLIFLSIMPFSCETDTSELKQFENPKIVFEYEFEMNSLNGDLFLLMRRKDELKAFLKEYPDNEKALKKLQIVDEKIALIKKRGDEINKILIGFGVGPIPLPGPCFDMPANCPILLKDIDKILIAKTDIFEMMMLDPKTDEVLYVFEDFTESEFGNNILEHKFDTENLDLPEFVKIVVRKFNEDREWSYKTYARFE